MTAVHLRSWEAAAPRSCSRRRAAFTSTAGRPRMCANARARRGWFARARAARTRAPVQSGRPAISTRCRTSWRGTLMPKPPSDGVVKVTGFTECMSPLLVCVGAFHNATPREHIPCDMRRFTVCVVYLIECVDVGVAIGGGGVDQRRGGAGGGVARGNRSATGRVADR
ncbi:hypothetical protein FRACA_400027 [Frankia canadensis]|uniref:Uncharacterized protein n=1 Tax=Frankia canadensis TaxID=1836972 RepID=A0A2I2KWQ7_9ACTN|nr:hypothetical protein FRACA_400027 [Frankia canadensis]SOU57384.1 hypothetical protein FRACA_400027 [Frankia canadensis]